jgi:4-methyl-5(b-hydroxyethyl)-thiazole monophosphate biosynthesis
MEKAALFIIQGFEETEAVTTLDILRRGEVETDLVSLQPGLEVTGSHGITLKADRLLEGLDLGQYRILVVPGGTIAYLDHAPFMSLMAEAARQGKRLAAICAAPAVLGRLGLLSGRRAACYPGFEKYLVGAILTEDKAVTDGPVTTSRGPSTALWFGLELLRLLRGPETADKIGRDILLLS